MAEIVNGAYGTRIHILTGAHGGASGSITPHLKFWFDDFVRFGKLPSVQVHNITTMSPAEITAVLRSQGTIITGFCHSSVCLRPYF